MCKGMHSLCVLCTLKYIKNHKWCKIHLIRHHWHGTNGTTEQKPSRWNEFSWNWKVSCVKTHDRIHFNSALCNTQVLRNTPGHTKNYISLSQQPAHHVSEFWAAGRHNFKEKKNDLTFHFHKDRERERKNSTMTFSGIFPFFLLCSLFTVVYSNIILIRAIAVFTFASVSTIILFAIIDKAERT